MHSLHLYNIVKVLYEHTPVIKIQTTLKHPVPHLQRGCGLRGPRLGRSSPSWWQEAAPTPMQGADSGLSESGREREHGRAGQGCRHLSSALGGAAGSQEEGPLWLAGFLPIPDVLMIQPGGAPP